MCVNQNFWQLKEGCVAKCPEIKILIVARVICMYHEVLCYTVCKCELNVECGTRKVKS